MNNSLSERKERYKKFIKKESCKKYAEYFGIALLSSIILCFVLMLLSHLYAKIFFEGKANELGDSFGSVNAVISSLAFLGVFLALVMQQRQIELQRKDLVLQRRELKNNTKELSLQRKEFEEQNRNIRLQRFENTFFQMLSLHHEIVSGLRISVQIYGTQGTSAPPIIVEGREVFKVLYEDVYLLLELYKLSQFEDFKGIKELLGKYNDIHDYSKVGELSTFDHYFRNLYRIFKFIDSTPQRNPNNTDDKEGVLTLKEKRNYAAIVRASLSEYELVMLFFNCIYMKVVVGEAQFKEFAEDYHLFNNIRSEKVGQDIFDSFMQNEKYKYKDSAFNW